MSDALSPSHLTDPLSETPPFNINGGTKKAPRVHEEAYSGSRRATHVLAEQVISNLGVGRAWSDALTSWQYPFVRYGACQWCAESKLRHTKATEDSRVDPPYCLSHQSSALL